MQKLILLLMLVVVGKSIAAQTDSSGCAMYHKGFFSFTDSVGHTVLVDRQKRYQYQKNIVTKVKTQFRITWTGGCSYEIQQTLTNSRAARKYKYSVTKVTISNTHGAAGYEYDCGCNDPKGKGYMKKLTKKEYYHLF